MTLLKFSMTLIIILANTPAYAEEFVAGISPNETIPVPGFSWKSIENIPVVFSLDNTKPTVQIELKGAFSEIKSILLMNDHPIQLKAQGAFQIKLYLSGEKTLLHVKTVDVNGKLNKLDYNITFPRWKEYLVKMALEQNKPVGFTASLGATSLTFSQTAFQDTSQISLLGSISFSRYFKQKSHFNYTATVSMGFLPISSGGDPNVAGHIQQLNLAATIGLDVFTFKAPAIFRIVSGYFYSTMLGTVGFGYINLNGISLSPTFSWQFKNKTEGLIYIRYAPVISGTQFLSFTASREIAGGLAYSIPFKNSKTIGAFLDYSSTQLIYTGQTLRVSALSFRLGYGF